MSVVPVMSVPRREVPGDSATKARHTTGKFKPSVAAYIDESERLLERSRSELVVIERITWAYRASLRAAGAAIEDARTGRRRSSGSAWSRLRAVDKRWGDWSDRFEVYARFVSRAEMGLEQGLRVEDAENFYATVCDFVDEVRAQVNYLPKVA